MSNKLCIFHSVDGLQHCDDGFASAYAFWTRYPDARFHPGVYNEPPPDVTGKDVYIVDFSYKLPVMREIIEQAHSVTILDHHKTAMDDINPLLEEGVCNGIFDMSRCGSMITWEWLYHAADGLSDPPPKVFHYIQDRDLWKNELEGTNEIIMALRSYPQVFDVWDNILDDPDALYEEGVSIHRYYRSRVEALKINKHNLRIGEHIVPAVNAPHFMASEIAGEICEDTFAVCYWYQHPWWVLSLRSRGDFDCGAVAKEHGGGGHRNAAGFRVAYLEDL